MRVLVCRRRRSVQHALETWLASEVDDVDDVEVRGCFE